MTFPHTATTFRAAFPEFKGDAVAGTVVPVAFLQRCLDEAEREIDANVWGEDALTGHGYLTAHKLALSPYGRDARLKTDDRKTTYLTEFERLERIVGTAHRLVIDESDIPGAIW